MLRRMKYFIDRGAIGEFDRLSERRINFACGIETQRREHCGVQFAQLYRLFNVPFASMISCAVDDATFDLGTG